MAEPLSFALTSTLAASAVQVWEHASSFAGVNRELWPFLRMTCPSSAAKLTPESIPLGAKVFRSWLLLGCLLPIDYDDFRLVELAPGIGFAEDSELLSARRWQHRRTIVPADDGCTVTDEIDFVPRFPWTGSLLGSIYRAAFRWRHARLRRIFGKRNQTPV